MTVLWPESLWVLPSGASRLNAAASPPSRSGDTATPSLPASPMAWPATLQNGVVPHRLGGAGMSTALCMVQLQLSQDQQHTCMTEQVTEQVTEQMIRTCEAGEEAWTCMPPSCVLAASEGSAQIVCRACGWLWQARQASAIQLQLAWACSRSRPSFSSRTLTAERKLVQLRHRLCCR